MIHKEGYTILITTLIIVSVIVFLVFKYTGISWVKYLTLAAGVVIFGLFLQFFRNPARHTVIDAHHVIAPADGKVVVIEEVEEPEYFEGKRIQLSIFMSPLNVHKQWYPINGKVEYTKYHPGKYLVAWHPKSSTENERSTIVVSAKNGTKILFRQIAGAVARRICNYAKEGELVTQENEAGFIKFGSRIDVFIPKTSIINVKIDDKIIGGKTILATI